MLSIIPHRRRSPEVAIHMVITRFQGKVSSGQRFIVCPLSEDLPIDRSDHSTALVTEAAACWCTVGRVVVTSFIDLSHSKHLSSQSKKQENVTAIVKFPDLCFFFARCMLPKFPAVNENRRSCTELQVFAIAQGI